MAKENRVALITGANKGIGYEIAAGLARLGITALIGARKPNLGDAAAAKLRAEGLDAHAIVLDITDANSIAAAVQRIEREFGRLDILVNNAGINIDQVPPMRPSATPMETVRQTFETNVFGAIAMIQAALPLLRKSAAARIVNVSSELGSLSQNSDPAYFHHNYVALAYPSAKSALNAVTIAFSKELRGTNIKINSVCPGLCATDLTGNYGTRTPEQGAAIAIRMATLPEDGPVGGYFNDAGRMEW